MTSVYSDVHIEITYAENFQRKVRNKNDSDPFGYMTATVDGEYLIGTEDSHVGLWLSEDLARLLAATEEIMSGKETMFTFRNGPSYLVIEPCNGTVGFTHCLHFEGAENPEERWEMETTFLISKQAWIAEILQVSEEYYHDVLSLNPSLEDEDYLIRLHEEIVLAKDRLNTVGGV